LCPQVGSGMGQFVGYWQQQDAESHSITQFHIVGLTATENEGTGSGQATVDVRYGSGSVQAMPLPLVEYGHRWFACPPSS
jgi:hypothetical protein